MDLDGIVFRLGLLLSEENDSDDSDGSDDNDGSDDTEAVAATATASHVIASAALEHDDPSATGDDVANTAISAVTSADGAETGAADDGEAHVWPSAASPCICMWMPVCGYMFIFCVYV